jgi:hypothetical protein
VTVAQVTGERQSPRILLRPERKGMLQRDPEDIDRKATNIVGAEPELHRVREVDLDIELLTRRVRGGSTDGAQQDEAKAKPSTAR